MNGLRLLPLTILFLINILSSARAQILDTVRHTLQNPSTASQPGVWQGASVAIDGTLTIVGAPGDIFTSASGAARVYDTQSGALKYLLKNPTPGSDLFGSSVAISGNRVFVGAMNDDTDAENSGSVYIYDLDSATPTTPTVALANPEPSNEYNFGSVVAASSELIAVAARTQDGGIVHIYNPRGTNSPTLIATLKSPDHAEFFGTALALFGARIAIADGAVSPLGEENQGTVYVFDFESASPTIPIATIPNPSPATVRRFGNSIAIYEDQIAIGAPLGDSGGCVFLYHLSDINSPPAVFRNSTPDTGAWFGNAIALSRDRLLVANRMGSLVPVSFAAVYAFDLCSSSPTALAATIRAPSVDTDRNFGNAVALSGDFAVIGDSLNRKRTLDAGCAYIYDLSNLNQTSPLAVLDHPTPASYEYFGSSVAVSENRVAVGAYGDDTGASNAGSVYIFDTHSLVPALPIVTVNNPAPSQNNYFGKSISLSGDMLIVGAPSSSLLETHIGSAYIYDLAGPTPNKPILILDDPTPQTADGFGGIVSISGNIAVVSATSYRGETSAIYVYNLSSQTPSEPILVLDKHDPSKADQFSSALALDEKHLVVGANSAGFPGNAYVYDLDDPGTVSPIVTIIDPDPLSHSDSTRAIAISQSRVVIAASSELDSNTTEVAYVYNLPATMPAAVLKMPISSANSLGIRSVAISGDRVVIGVKQHIHDGTSRGGAYVYDLSSSDPIHPVAVFEEVDPDVDTGFGAAVAIDGTTVAVGAPLTDEDVPARGRAYIIGPEVTVPTGGSFTVSPASPVLPDTVFSATFSGWTDVSLPLTYSVFVDSSVLVSASENALPTFSLPVGQHSVFGRISDSLGNHIDTEPITLVVDGGAPVITTPGNLSLPTAYSTGRKVDFEVSAVDDFDPQPNMVVEPPSGFIFPVGSTTVNVTATDHLGHMSTASFTVTISVGPLCSEVRAEGGRVPGAGTDSRIQDGAVWTGFGSPAVGDGGHVAFLGKWTAPAVSTPAPLKAQKGVGVFVDDVLVARAGEAVNGIEGAVYKSFKDPVIDARGRVAFLATIAGKGISATHDIVVMSNGRSGTLEVLAHEGAEAPESGGALFKSFGSVSIEALPDASASGTVFTAVVRKGPGGAAVKAGNNSGAWWLPAGGSEVIKLVRKGDAIGAETIKTFQVLSALAGSPGHGRGQIDGASAFVRLTTSGATGQRQVLALAEPGTLTEFTGTGSPIAASSSANWQDLGMPSSDQDGDNLTVLGSVATLGGPVQSAILTSTDRGENWAIVAAKSNDAPNMGDGAHFSGFKDPVNSGTDASFAFLGTAKGGSATKATDTGIWYAQPGAEPSLIAREGDRPPGAPQGAQWKSFSSLVLPGGGTGPLFTAFLKTGAGGVSSKSDFALYGTASTTEIFELVRENQPLLGKPVKTFTVLKAVSGSEGVGRSYDAAGDVVVLVTYTDGETAMVRITVP